ncbi:Ig-like domain-containing protein, partial [Spirosoma utsteinense]|uniref:Ig-like domain-containing protein n=1 Tax=Spirosoma utsteinense TaxID=2585773 RepID=UPI001647EF9D
MQAQPSSFTSAQIEVGTDCNWPYSAIATNPTDGKMYALWRKGADVSVTYKLIRWDGSSWTQLSTFTTATGTSSSNKVPDFSAATDRVSLAIDGTGRFHVTFSGISASAGRQGIWYGLSTNGTSWSFQALQILAANSTNESLAEEVIEVDAQNQPHVAFRYNIAVTPRTYTLRYYRFTGGNWVGETAFTQSGSSNGGTTSNEIGRFDLAIDGNAKAHFSFRRETAGTGRDGSLYYINNTTGSWSTPQELVTGATDQPQAVTNTIDTDAANKIHIVHSDYQKKLYYTTNVSGSFVTSQINGNVIGDVNSQHTLRINANGDKFLVYNDSQSGPSQLNYAYQLAGTSGSTWTTGTGFTPNASGRGGNYYSGLMNNDRRIMLLFDNSPTSTSGQCNTFTRNFWYATATVTAPLPTTAPVVTTPANGSLLITATPVYTGTAPAGSTVTFFVDGTPIGTTTATGGNFSLTQPTALAQGSHTVQATAQGSGQAVSGNSNTNTFTIDSVRPSVSITSTAGTTGGSTGTSPIPFTVSFSESVTGFVAGDVTVTNGTLSGFSGSGTTYTFNVTPSANGTVTVNVPANVAQDAAGNGNTAAASQFTITYAQPLTAAPVVIAP